MMAEMRMQADMAQVPLVSNTSEGQILENYMDETVEKPIASYAEAKSAVKQSFLGRMVGPAFAASLLAAAASVMPFPAGAYDKMPDVWATTGRTAAIAKSATVAKTTAAATTAATYS